MSSLLTSDSIQQAAPQRALFARVLNTEAQVGAAHAPGERVGCDGRTFLGQDLYVIPMPGDGGSASQVGIAVCLAVSVSHAAGQVECPLTFFRTGEIAGETKFAEVAEGP